MWDPNGLNMTKPAKLLIFMLHKGSEEACIAQSTLLMGSAQVLHETSLALCTLSSFTVPTVTLEVLPKVVTWWHSSRYKLQVHTHGMFMHFLSYETLSVEYRPLLTFNSPGFRDSIPVPPGLHLEHWSVAASSGAGRHSWKPLAASCQPWIRATKHFHNPSIFKEFAIGYWWVASC